MKRVAELSLVIIEVLTDEGISGFGESTPREGIIQTISEIKKRIIGGSLRHSKPISQDFEAWSSFPCKRD